MVNDYGRGPMLIDNCDEEIEHVSNDLNSDNEEEEEEEQPKPRAGELINMSAVLFLTTISRSEASKAQNESSFGF